MDPMIIMIFLAVVFCMVLSSAGGAYYWYSQNNQTTITVDSSSNAAANANAAATTGSGTSTGTTAAAPVTTSVPTANATGIPASTLQPVVVATFPQNLPTVSIPAGYTFLANTDIIGNDISCFSGDPGQCLAPCTSNYACGGYVTIPNGYSSDGTTSDWPNGGCCMKNNVSAAAQSTSSGSGGVNLFIQTNPAPAVNTTPPAGYTFASDININGNDINCYSGDPGQCLAPCNGDPTCMGYVTVPNNFSSDWANGGCCTKNNVSSSVQAASPGGSNLFSKIPPATVVQAPAPAPVVVPVPSTPVAPAATVTSSNTPPTAYAGYSAIPNTDVLNNDLTCFQGNQNQCVAPCNTTTGCAGFVTIPAGYSAAWEAGGCCMKSTAALSAQSASPGGVTLYTPTPPSYTGYITTPYTDIVGDDLTCFAGNQNQCAAPCNANNGCKGFVTIPTGFSSAWESGGCCMKSSVAVSARSPSPGGVTLYAENPGYTLQSNTDILGDDIQCYQGDEMQCAGPCNNNLGCLGFVSIPKNFDTNYWVNGGCCTKSNVTSTAPSPGGVNLSVKNLFT